LAIQYRVYKNLLSGGPIDLTTPLATMAGLTYETAALARPFDHWFLVRAFDTVTGFEDLNTDARARLVLDAAGANITNRPSPPSSLSARPVAAGGLDVTWAYLPTAGGGTPTGFKVWAQVGAINYALTPTLASYDPDAVMHLATVPSLTHGATYTVAVRAYNATADDGNTLTTTAIPDAVGPLAVDDLDGQPTF